MQRNIFPLVVLSCLLITFFSCSNKPKKRPRKPVSSIQVQPKKPAYTYGEKITVNVSTKLKDGEIKNIDLLYGNTVVKSTTELEFSANNITLNQIGENNLTVNAEKTDGLKNSRSKKVTVLSDVTPEELTYHSVNNYPHLKTSYTQGLEFYKGHLYEGTGEYGHSKLLKIDLKTGKAIQSIDMDEKFFGEGITILNDKIYQLTYHAQKGFVYDVNNFAVIDSFSYKSKQGWGLTNDGKHLIMSDGTHVLTWLDPEKFTVVKKVQVANDRGIVNNLNELEYIDGVIYANIYTTDKIVKIDAEKGKVLEHIDLKGIINLYHKDGERIDYLNGIAFNKQTGKLYVTGKLYPRLFEVQFIPKK